MKKMCLENENFDIHFLNAISYLPDSIATTRKQKMKSQIRYQAAKIKNYKNKLKKLRSTTKKLTRNNNVLNILPFLTYLITVAKTLF